MNNRPFYSTNTNVYDQSVFSTAPTNFNGQNVLISQEQQRKMFDTLNTSIMGMPCCCPQQLSSQIPGNGLCPQQLPNQMPGNVMHAQKQFVPGGVMFSFNTQPGLQPQGFLSQQVCCTIPGSGYFPVTLEQQMAASAMQKHGLETLQYQQQLASNPFLLKFHHNSGTSCTDMLNAPTQVPGSRSSPDFTNICGAVYMQTEETQQKHCPHEEFCNQPLAYTKAQISTHTPIDFCRNIKRLHLSKVLEKPKGHVADIIDTAPSASDEVRSSPRMEDKAQQVALRCYSENETDPEKLKKNKKKTKLHKIKKKKDSDSSESSEEEACLKTTKTTRNKKKCRNKSDSQYYSTTNSE